MRWILFLIFFFLSFSCRQFRCSGFLSFSSAKERAKCKYLFVFISFTNWIFKESHDLHNVPTKSVNGWQNEKKTIFRSFAIYWELENEPNISLSMQSRADDTIFILIGFRFPFFSPLVFHFSFFFPRFEWILFGWCFQQSCSFILFFSCMFIF